MPAPVLGPSDSAGSSHPHSGTRTPRFTRLVVALGLASTIVAFGGVVPAMLLAPWFSPFEHAPSYPGIAGLGTAPLFNGSLLVGGAGGPDSSSPSGQLPSTPPDGRRSSSSFRRWSAWP